MNYLQVSLGGLIWSVLVGSLCIDPCSNAKPGTEKANRLAGNTVFTSALKNIQTAFDADGKEHVIAFGRDEHKNIYASAVSNGTNSSGTVPFVNHAFADLHNHPNNIPPDAGDLYGLIDINKDKPGYNIRITVTAGGTLYALLITDTAAAIAFNKKYPRQPPAYAGAQPAFPAELVDEFREIKYRYHGTDEMAMAFILEKYTTGVSLLKQNDNGEFKRLRTVVSGAGDDLHFRLEICE